MQAVPAYENFPTIISKHLDALDINEDECTALGASSLTARFWLGSLWFYTGPDVVSVDENNKAAIETAAGMSDIKWVTNRKLAAGLDSGTIGIWELNEDCSEVHMKAQEMEHENGITTISLTADKQQLVSASKDARIKIWNIDELASTTTYKAHWDAIWCVACNSVKPTIFTSCSQDGRLLLWDTRNAKPAKMLEGVCSNIPTCAAWHTTEEHSLAVGTETGSICIIDTRQEKSPVKSNHIHSRPVHRLQYSKLRSNWLASCSEDCTVAVIDTSLDDIRFFYRDTRHTDFVQGLCWNPKSNKLYSTGWDYEVLSHDITESSSNNTTNSSMQI